MTYVLFEKLEINYRPVLMDGVLEASYPSSHTLLALCICGSTMILNRFKYPRIKMDMLGVVFLFVSYIVYLFTDFSIYISLFILCIGNAFLHVSGAELTLKTSNGKLSSPAIFVAGGSFGVISGKLMAKYSVSPYIILPLILTLIPFALLANTYDDGKKEVKYNSQKIKSNTR